MNNSGFELTVPIWAGSDLTADITAEFSVEFDDGGTPKTWYFKIIWKHVCMLNDSPAMAIPNQTLNYNTGSLTITP